MKICCYTRVTSTLHIYSECCYVISQHGVKRKQLRQKQINRCTNIRSVSFPPPPPFFSTSNEKGPPMFAREREEHRSRLLQDSRSAGPAWCGLIINEWYGVKPRGLRETLPSSAMKYICGLTPSLVTYL